MVYNYRIKGDDFTLFRITGFGGYYATLVGTSGQIISVPVKEVIEVDHSQPIEGALTLPKNNTGDSSMKNPQHCNKASLLTAVEELNGMGAKLRVASGTMAKRVNTISTAVEKLNHTEMLEHLTDKALAELTAWGIISGFINVMDGGTLPDGLQKTRDLIEAAPDTYYQADEVVEFQGGVPERPEWAKWEDALNDKDNPPSKKKAAKLKAKIAKAKEAAGAVDTEPEKKSSEKKKEKSESKTDEKTEVKTEETGQASLVKSLTKELKKLVAQLTDTTKKKKRKKLGLKINAVQEQLDNLDTFVKDEAKKQKVKKKKGPGVILSILTVMKESGKAMTHEEICTELSKLIDKTPESFLKTVKAQLGAKSPVRLEKEKGGDNGFTIKVKGGDKPTDRTYTYKEAK